jgi:hypothetical protein
MHAAPAQQRLQQLRWCQRAHLAHERQLLRARQAEAVRGRVRIEAHFGQGAPSAPRARAPPLRLQPRVSRAPGDSAQRFPSLGDSGAAEARAARAERGAKAARCRAAVSHGLLLAVAGSCSAALRSSLPARMAPGAMQSRALAGAASGVAGVAGGAAARGAALPFVPCARRRSRQRAGRLACAASGDGLLSKALASAEAAGPSSAALQDGSRALASLADSLPHAFDVGGALGAAAAALSARADQVAAAASAAAADAGAGPLLARVGAAADALGASALAALPSGLQSDAALTSQAAQQLLGFAARNAAEAPLLVALVALSAGAGLAIGAAAPGASPAADVLPTAYDPALIAAYYARRPGTLRARQSSLASQAGAFLSRLLWDKQTGQWEANMPTRAAELRALIVAQGAAFIKVGQALAIRPDILPPVYLTEFAKLLDQVPPFEALEAQAALRGALAARGLTPEEVFVDVAAFDKPIAAASIGQVYRAQLRPGAAGGPPRGPPPPRGGKQTPPRNFWAH